MTEEILTEEEMREFEQKFNDRLGRWEDKMDELKEEMGDMMELLGKAVNPIVKKYYQSLATIVKGDKI